MAQRNGLLTFAIGPQRNHNCHSCRRRRTNAAHALLLLQQWRQRERNIITTCWCCCCGLVQSSSMRYVHYNKLSSSSSNFNDVALEMHTSCCLCWWCRLNGLLRLCTTIHKRRNFFLYYALLQLKRVLSLTRSMRAPKRFLPPPKKKCIWHLVEKYTRFFYKNMGKRKQPQGS